MKLKDKLFIMEGDQPHLSPIGMHIPEFQKLWAGDKTEEKMQYAKELAYIYHMHEYDSPYYDRKNKEEEIIRDFIGKKWKPTKRVLIALAKYKSLDKTAEKRSLDAAMVACDTIAKDLSGLKQESSQMAAILDEIEREIRSSDTVHQKVDLLKMRLDLQEQKMKIAKLIADIMPRLEKTIETIISLRRKVTTSVFKGESSDSIVGDFLIDKLYDELDYEQSQNEE